MIRSYKITRFRSAKKLVQKYVNLVAGRKVNLKSVDTIQMHGETVTLGEFMGRLHEHGSWAFVDIVKKGKGKSDLYWWARPGQPIEDICHMLGHELGHLTNNTLRDMEAEEDRADTYGDVAREVAMLTSRMRPSRRR